MRTGIVVVGVVLLVVGAVLLFVPITPQPSQKIASNSSTPVLLFSVSGFSVTGSIPISVSWSSTGPVTVAAATCSGTCQNRANVSDVSGITLQSGTSGSFTLNQPNGGEVLIAAVNTGGGNATTTTFNVTTALSTVGTILLIVGILLLIVGVVVKAKSKPVPMQMAPPMDQSTGMADSPPPPTP
jgi:uncharacterized membrane protein